MQNETLKGRPGRAKKLVAIGATVAVGLTPIVAVASPSSAATAGGFTYTVSGGKATITGCSIKCPSKLVIPAKLRGVPVRTIGEMAFYDSGIRTVTFARGSAVTRIEVAAFRMNHLSKVTVPASVRSIGDTAFYGNPVKELRFAPKSKLTTIGAVAFELASLTSVMIPASVTSIGAAAFLLNKLKTVQFAAGSKLKTIDNTAFASNRLHSITFPKSLRSIGHAAFQDNPSLNTVRFQGSKPLLGEDAFLQTGSKPIFVSAKATGWANGQTINGRRVVRVAMPKIQSQTKRATVARGKKKTLKVRVKSATGQGTMTYQWYLGKKRLKKAHKAALKVSKPGNYRVKVTSWVGTTTSKVIKVKRK